MRFIEVAILSHPAVPECLLCLSSSLHGFFIPLLRKHGLVHLCQLLNINYLLILKLQK
uniref:Uncharacterized protein n=1 Tax=Oryza brachyantha TaxID=4533 RepID=J3L5J1_ORYBR